MHQGDPVAEGGQPLAGGLESDGISVEPDKRQVIASRQQRGTVAAAADGGVDQYPGGHRCEESHHFVAQDGSVGECLGHLQLLERREGRRK